jgi:hypothetical protein
MKALLRNILALLAGVFSGVILISLLEQFNVRLYPPPSGFDPRNAESVKAYAATLPPPAFLIVLGSYLVGFTAAVFLATRLSGSVHHRQGVLAAAFFGAASVMNLLALPHPVWFWVANLVVLVAAAWLGLRWGLPKAARG